MNGPKFKVGDRVKFPNSALFPQSNPQFGTIIHAPKTARGCRYLVVVDGLSLNGKPPEECPQSLHETFLEGVE